MNNGCPKCGGEMQAGVATAKGLIGSVSTKVSAEPRLVFIVPGAPTSPNPIEAFKQGLANEPTGSAFRIRGVRCAACGFLELYALEPSAGDWK